jgi:Na+/H+-dicarboxylate symporter
MDKGNGHGKGNLLTLLIVIGLVAGCIVGEFIFFRSVSDSVSGALGKDHWTYLAGQITLIRPLKLMIIPLVFVSVVVGVTSIGDPSKLGVVGGSTVLYYIATMLLAVTLGTALVSTFQPGALDQDKRDALTTGAEETYRTSGIESTIASASGDGDPSIARAFLEVVKQLIPENIVQEMADGRTLGVIVFSLFLGLALAAGGSRTEPAILVFRAMFEAIMKLVGWIIWLTPIGVFWLITWTVGNIGFTHLVGPISKYIIVVLAGLFVHGAIVLPLILAIFTRRNPYRFMWQMRRALMTAFGTDSSSATLPVTIDAAENEGGCSKRAANFVLPLGATVNMDGTALYEAVAVVFLFQLYGIELEFSQLLIVVITATLAAIGAAGIPSAGLVMMVIVINAVNTSLSGTGKSLGVEAIGVIIGVDRIVDMCRTMVNVWGDAVGAKIMTRIAPDDPEDLTAVVSD